jgi:hypothetical protein
MLVYLLKLKTIFIKLGISTVFFTIALVHGIIVHRWGILITEYIQDLWAQLFFETSYLGNPKFRRYMVYLNKYIRETEKIDPSPSYFPKFHRFEQLIFSFYNFINFWANIFGPFIKRDIIDSYVSDVSFVIKDAENCVLSYFELESLRDPALFYEKFPSKAVIPPKDLVRIDINDVLNESVYKKRLEYKVSFLKLIIISSICTKIF